MEYGKVANSSNGSQMKKNDQLNVKRNNLLIILLNNPIKKLMENKALVSHQNLI